ncbi:beta-N-acetylhexosaminidase [Streptomyces sp. XM4193]|uniref:family 20 glycosylhydrolase n=1 Tax=Streptomyces sp. XM4193 TaxID=2929782 RepID=UPI001FF71C9F|nr:family 20 glycosylhydrolase [Streptomyces sp. XM4193]MCK1798088.1 beta-N-acetylhexosaminidase [Streptomyces sp. XM4193]
MTTTAGGAPYDAPVTATVDDTTPAQGYRLRTGPEGVSVHHRDAAGLRYALDTLDQLRAGPDYPEVGYEIVDAPDFPVRGFHLDISRDRVPTRRTLERWLGILARARFNHLELYCEHTYAYRDHREVWQDASPLTADDLRWLDARCAALGIDLVANQNTFGHMERFLAHQDHAHRAENPDGFERGGQHRPPSTLEPTEENADFANGLLRELAGNLRTRRVNIGADEPFELGTGRSKERAAADGLGNVYLDYVTSVMRPWLEAGWTVQFWADVFGNHPELMDRVPPGAIPVVWQYDSPRAAAEVLAEGSEELRSWTRVGSDVERLSAGFRGRAKLLREAGVPFWVAPGTGNWNSIIGRLDNAVENMIDAAEVGLEQAAEGFLLTSWGDHGMWDPPSVSFGPALYGGAVSWCLEANRDLDIAGALNDHVLLDPTGRAGAVLDRLGRVAEVFGVPLLNASPIARALFPQTGPLPALPTLQALAEAGAVLESCRHDLAAADPAAADRDVLRRELEHAIALSEFAVRLLHARARSNSRADGIDPSAAERLLLELDPLLAEQRACWLLRSRPGGLDDSLARIDLVRHELVSAAQR